MKTIRTLLAVLLIASLSLFAFVPALAEGTLRVGMECNYAPYNWTQAEPNEFTVPIEGGAGYADGYDVQIARLIAEGLGKELVIVKTEWNGLPVGVISGAFDAIIAGMSPTAERKLSIDFSDNYYKSELVVVVRADSAYAQAKTLADFAGATVTGQQNTFHYQVVDQLTGANKGIAMKDFPTMTIALKSGAIDGYIAELPGAISDTSANPELSYVQFAEGQGFVTSEDDVAIAIGLPKGSELTASINGILAGIDEETRVALMREATVRQPLNTAE